MFQPFPGKPFGIMTLRGKNPDLPSIFLYSHSDVVPVFPVIFSYIVLVKFEIFPKIQNYNRNTGNTTRLKRTKMKTVTFMVAERKIWKALAYSTFLLHTRIQYVWIIDFISLSKSLPVFGWWIVSFRSWSGNVLIFCKFYYLQICRIDKTP